MLRSHGIEPASRIRKTRVGLDDNRKGCTSADPLYNRHKVLRSERAVYADGICAKRIQRECHGLRICSGKCPLILFECHRDPDREGRVFFRGKHRSAHFRQIGHRLKNDKIRPCLLPRDHHFAKAVIGLLKGEGSERLHEFPDRSDIQGNLYISPGKGGRGLFRGSDIRCDHIMDRIRAAFILAAVDAKCIRVDDIASGFDIASVDSGNDIFMLHAEELRLFAALQPGFLKHGSHGAVKEQDLSLFHFGFLF